MRNPDLLRMDRRHQHRRVADVHRHPRELAGSVRARRPVRPRGRRRLPHRHPAAPAAAQTGPSSCRTATPRPWSPPDEFAPQFHRPVQPQVAGDRDRHPRRRGAVVGYLVAGVEGMVSGLLGAAMMWLVFLALTSLSIQLAINSTRNDPGSPCSSASCSARGCSSSSFSSSWPSGSAHRRGWIPRCSSSPSSSPSSAPRLRRHRVPAGAHAVRG